MVTSKTHAQAPARSLDQRMEALQRANDIRVRRAQLKKDLKDGRAHIETILLDPSVSGRSSSTCSTTGDRRLCRRSRGTPAVDAVRPVIVVTGPSGAGKGTLIRAILERIPELEVAISATTRPQRPGEENGREYWFLTDEEFTARAEEGAFLEWVEYVSHKRYGTLRSEIDRITAHGRVCVLELETDGALHVQAEVPGACTIFIAADVEELERRLRERATESTGEIGERITIARRQLEQAHRFRYMVRNDDLTRASEVLAAIVERELVLAGTMLHR